MATGFENPSELNRHVESVFVDIQSLAGRMQSETVTRIVEAAQMIHDGITSRHKILVCGNGGSAAEAQHFAAELVGRFLVERDPLPAVALTVDTSILTAVGNDYGFEQVFARQVQALGLPGDVLVVMSTSGISANVLAAVSAAGQRGLRTIALVGSEAPPELRDCDLVITVPDSATPRIQEMHLVILHLLCDLLDSITTGDT